MTPRSRIILSVSAAVLLFCGGWAAGGALKSAPSSPAAQDPAPGATPVANPGAGCGDGSSSLVHSFPSGSSWSLCWHIDPQQGLTLSDAVYTAPGKAPLTVLKEMELSQLEVPYDTGVRVTKDITEHGFGGRSMKTLGSAECAGDRVNATLPDFGSGAVGGSESRAVLCTQEVDAGLARRSEYYPAAPIAQRGRAFELSTVSVVGWYEYMTLYRFGEDGTITPKLGATGDLSPEDYTSNPRQGSPVGPGTGEAAASHSHNAVWRIRWGLPGPQTVQEYNADFTGQRGPAAAVLEGTLTALATESLRSAESRRWWQVLSAQDNPDGHRMSYQIQLDSTDGYTPHSHDDSTAHQGVAAGDAGFGYDAAFTQYKDCERFATQNTFTGCPTQGVPQFADGEKLTDVVSWVSVSYHHVPRDEDQSPMDTHWQGFSLLPRDAFAQNPLTPSSRATINGKPPAK